MRRLGILAIVLIFSFVFATASLAETTPTDDLKKSIDAVISLLADKKMDRKLRREKVIEKIHERFDFEAMGKFILGQNWRSLNEAQRGQFVDRFSQILQNTYMNRIEAYSDEKVKYNEEKRIDDKAKVATSVVHKNKEVPIDYKLQLKNGGWYIYDVTIEGVSLVRNYQESYNEIFRKNGIDGLLAKMSEKITEMENGKASK